MTSEGGIYSGFWNIVSIFTLHTMQKPQETKKNYLFYSESLKPRLGKLCSYILFYLFSSLHNYD